MEKTQAEQSSLKTIELRLERKTIRAGSNVACPAEDPAVLIALIGGYAILGRRSTSDVQLPGDPRETKSVLPILLSGTRANERAVEEPEKQAAHLHTILKQLNVSDARLLLLRFQALVCKQLTGKDHKVTPFQHPLAIYADGENLCGDAQIYVSQVEKELVRLRTAEGILAGLVLPSSEQKEALEQERIASAPEQNYLHFGKHQTESFFTADPNLYPSLRFPHSARIPNTAGMRTGWQADPRRLFRREDGASFLELTDGEALFRFPQARSRGSCSDSAGTIAYCPVLPKAMERDPLTLYSFENAGDIIGAYQSKDAERIDDADRYFRWHARRLQDCLADPQLYASFLELSPEAVKKLDQGDITALANTLSEIWPKYFAHIANPYAFFDHKGCYSPEMLKSMEIGHKTAAFTLFAQRKVAEMLKNDDKQLYAALIARFPEACLTDKELRHPPASYYGQIADFVEQVLKSGQSQNQNSSELFRTGLHLVVSPYAGRARAASFDPVTHAARCEEQMRRKGVGKLQKTQSDEEVLTVLASLHDAEVSTRFFEELPDQLLVLGAASKNKEEWSKVWTSLIRDFICITEHEQKLRAAHDPDGAKECARVTKLLRSPAVSWHESGRTFRELCSGPLYTDYALSRRLFSCFAPINIEFASQYRTAVRQEAAGRLAAQAGVRASTPGTGAAGEMISLTIQRRLSDSPAEDKMRGYAAKVLEDPFLFLPALLLLQQGGVHDEASKLRADINRHISLLCMGNLDQGSKDKLQKALPELMEQLDELGFENAPLTRSLPEQTALLTRTVARMKQDLQTAKESLLRREKEAMEGKIRLYERVLTLLPPEKTCLADDPLQSFTFPELSDCIEASEANGYITPDPAAPSQSTRNKEACRNYNTYLREYGTVRTLLRRELEKQISFPQKPAEYLMRHCENFVRYWESELKKTTEADEQKPEWKSLDEEERIITRFQRTSRLFERAWRDYITSAQNPYTHFQNSYSSELKKAMQFEQKQQMFPAWLEMGLAQTLRQQRYKYPEAYEHANRRFPAAMYGIADLGDPWTPALTAEEATARAEYIDGLAALTARALQGVSGRANVMKMFSRVLFGASNPAVEFYGQCRYDAEAGVEQLFEIGPGQRSLFSAIERQKLLSLFVSEVEEAVSGVHGDYGWMPQGVIERISYLAAEEEKRSRAEGAISYYVPVAQELSYALARTENNMLKNQGRRLRNEIEKLCKVLEAGEEIKKILLAGGALTTEQQRVFHALVPLQIAAIAEGCWSHKEKSVTRSNLLEVQLKGVRETIRAGERALGAYEESRDKLQEVSRQLWKQCRILSTLSEAASMKAEDLRKLTPAELREWPTEKLARLSRAQVAELTDVQIMAIGGKAGANKWLRERCEDLEQFPAR